MAEKIQCEYVPRDSSRNIIYTGSDADHRPWSRELEKAECLLKCSREFSGGLMAQCASGGGILDAIPHDPENCDATYTTCGETTTPTLTIKCKFTPRKSDGSEVIVGGFEVLTATEDACNYLCGLAKAQCLGASLSSLLCDETKTTCEKLSPVAEPPAPHQFESVTPTLEIPLPTLPSLSQFADLTLQGDAPNRYLLIPWLGQYIAAIYKYAIGVVGILAGIMIVIGGLLWLTAGGDAGKVSTAKSFIESSLVGLVIALTSYLLLFAINPKLTEFDSLKVKYIEEATWNNVDTAAASEAAASDTSVPEGSRPIATSEKCDESLSRCFVTFSAEAQADTGTGPGNTRALEFMKKLIPSSGSTRAKVTAVANAAANCCVILGSCGESNLRINYLAGVPQATAGQRGRNVEEALKNGLGVSTRGIVRHSVYSYSDLWAYLDTMNCDGSIPDCKSAEQIRKVYEKLRSGIGDGYPDSWADELQAGDSIVIFNANSSTRGGHAVIFMGWTSRAGVASVVQGSPGKVVKRGTVCLKSTCGLPFPLTSTYKPEP